MARFRFFQRTSRSLSRRPLAAGSLLVIVAFLSAMLASMSAGHPQPSIHDEFSYLLAADTFAHFRLANPTHPLWIFFESMHILQQPAYASMYPPGQGMAMAIGQIITGDPLVGVWLTAAIMCGAIYWMLKGWLPARWALFGGVLVLLKYVVLGRAIPGDTAGYWSQSYWGGAVAATGGAMMYGALGRVLRSTCRRRSAEEQVIVCPLTDRSRTGNAVKAWHAVFLALGAGIVANSRPFEGFLASLPACIVLLAWFVRLRGAARAIALKRVVIPAAIVGVGVATFMAIYNMRTTGKPTELAWQHHYAQYSTFPIFIWQRLPNRPLGSVLWNHKELEEFHGTWEVSLWKRTRSVKGLVVDTGLKIKALWAFYVAPVPRIGTALRASTARVFPGRIAREMLGGQSVFEMIVGTFLTLPLLVLPWTLRLRGVKFALIVCAMVVLGNLTTVATFPHYAAPAAAMFVLLHVQCLRSCAASRHRLARVVFGGVLVMTVLSFLCAFNPAWRKARRTWQYERARLLVELQATLEPDLIIVRYGPDHSVHDEWVYNDADIDAAKVVWARDMGDAKNRRLLEYFKDRKVWLLEVSEGPALRALGPYPGH